jgi:hypothetical protein
LAILSLLDYVTSGGKYPKFWEEFHALPNAGELSKNAVRIIALASQLCARVGVDPVVTSGWRSPSHNKAIGGSMKSNHLWCNAVDLWDKDKRLGEWCVSNEPAMAELGIWIESPVVTHKADDPFKRWCHIQSVAPASCKRIFMP